VAPWQPPARSPDFAEGAHVIWPILVLRVALAGAVSLASPTAQFWEELGRSATGPAGISGSVRGVVPEHRNVSIAIDADGRPVVAWGESGADDQMRIFVRR
jgi:hypothetical protein